MASVAAVAGGDFGQAAVGGLIDERAAADRGRAEVGASEQLAPLKAPLVVVNVTLPVGVTGVPAPASPTAATQVFCEVANS